MSQRDDPPSIVGHSAGEDEGLLEPDMHHMIHIVTRRRISSPLYCTLYDENLGDIYDFISMGNSMLSALLYTSGPYAAKHLSDYHRNIIKDLQAFIYHQLNLCPNVVWQSLSYDQFVDFRIRIRCCSMNKIQLSTPTDTRLSLRRRTPALQTDAEFLKSFLAKQASKQKTGTSHNQENTQYHVAKHNVTQHMSSAPIISQMSSEYTTHMCPNSTRISITS